MTRPLAWHVALSLALGLSLGSPARAQTRAPATVQPSAGERADQLLAAMDWPRAAEAYQQVVRLEPANARAWFRLGVARAQTGDQTRAAEAFEKAGELGLADSPKVAWEAAIAYARMKNEQHAIDWLSRVVDGGLRSRVLASTSDFDFMRDDPSFQALIARSTSNDETCKPQTYGALDFWVGQWAVYDQDRVRVGVDTVEKTPDGCALIETWSGTLGDSGRSLNVFDSRAGRWTQIWIGDTGGVVIQQGSVVEGQVRFMGETQRADGTKAMNRLTIAPLAGGRVRQLAEISTDGGRTWTTQFDFTYVPITK